MLKGGTRRAVSAKPGVNRQCGKQGLSAQDILKLSFSLKGTLQPLRKTLPECLDTGFFLHDAVLLFSG